MPRRAAESDVAEFAHAIGLLLRRVRAAAAAHGLSLTESAVMARLEKDGPATIAELARAEGIRPQSMGATVAGLEERGLLERRPHPTDGRQMNILLTTKGASVRRSVGDAKRTWLAQAIARLDNTERDTLFAAGRIMRQLVER